MIRILGICIKPEEDGSEALLREVSKKLRLDETEIKQLRVVKKSLDARNKADIHWNYIADAAVEDEEKIFKLLKHKRNIMKTEEKTYDPGKRGCQPLKTRPCIVGAGPCGLFCAYFLAKEGYRPVLIEQGESAPERRRAAEKFWKEGLLNPLSNIQFGEGGAGTFSDGKLYTGVNDKSSRNMKVLETLVENGAPQEILYMNRPHIGTDILSDVVVNMRKKITDLGGEVLFNTRFADFAQRNGKLVSIALESGSGVFIRPCSVLVIAPGNSSRDTFCMLNSSGLEILPKSFAVGVRAQHLQSDINAAMYGKDSPELPPADYKLTYKAANGRGVYTFCMCPGGYVVNSSSEEGCLCINGMSYSDRAGKNANSAVVVTINPEDTGADKNPLKGIDFQRDLERKAYEQGKGSIPVQRLEDFMLNRPSERFGRILPQTKGSSAFADINQILPEYICSDIKEAFREFGRKIKGFDDPDCVLSAVESRTSSPVRIVRDEHFESRIKGIFPAGEGAGYSGGITSSAIDGIKVFEEIYKRYAPK